MTPTFLELCATYSKAHAAHAEALAALGTGTCSAVRIYACDTVALAKSADISVVRAGERIELAL